MTSESGSLTAADVARLAAVQRPVVSMWRSRYADTGTPFPDPIEPASGRPRFRHADVEQWLRETGRAPGDTRRWDADRLVRAVWARESELADALLAVFALVACGVPLDDIRTAADAAWRAEECDPDEEHLLPLVLRCASRWAEAVNAVETADVTPEEFADALVAHLPVTVDVGRFVGGLAAALLGASRCRGVCVRSVGSGGVAWLVAASLARRGLVVQACAVRDKDAHRLRAWSLICAGGADRDAQEHHLTVVDTVGATPRQTAAALRELSAAPPAEWLVAGPASCLCDPVGAGEVGVAQAALIRDGSVEAAVRLPSGVLKDAPRVEVGLWLGSPAAGRHRGGQAVWGRAVSADGATEAGGESVADDVRELRRQRNSAGGVRLRSVRDWRAAERARCAAGTVSLAPQLPHVYAVESLAGLEDAAAVVRAGVAGVDVRAVVGDDAVGAAGGVASLGDLVDRGFAAALAGVRVPGEAFRAGERFEVWEPGSVAGGSLRTVRATSLAAGVGTDRETRPGDVVFCSGLAPAATVDGVGGRIPAFPCRVVRLAAGCPVSAHAVADALGRAEGSRSAWRAAEVWVPPPEHRAQVAKAAEELARAADQARTLARAADRAMQSVVGKPTDRAARLVLAATVKPSHDTHGKNHLRKEGVADATA